MNAGPSFPHTSCRECIQPASATNIGAAEAVLSISFNTAFREAVGYDTK
jgi:hypothetical protein